MLGIDGQSAVVCDTCSCRSTAVLLLVNGCPARADPKVLCQLDPQRHCRPRCAVRCVGHPLPSGPPGSIPRAAHADCFAAGGRGREEGVAWRPAAAAAKGLRWQELHVLCSRLARLRCRGVRHLSCGLKEVDSTLLPLLPALRPLQEVAWQEPGKEPGYLLAAPILTAAAWAVEQVGPLSRLIS